MTAGESAVMEFGKRFEPVAVQWFADKRPGLHVIGEQTWCTHPEHPWARATVDGFVAESEASDIADALGGYEGKCDFHGGATWAEEIPVHYQAQAQWQMMVTGMPRTWFGVLHPFGRFEVYELARNDDDIATLYKAAHAFWFDHVLTGVPPATDGTDATTDALAAAWGDPSGLVELDAALVDAYRQATEDAKQADEAKKAAGNALRAALGEHTEGTVNGKRAASWKPQTSDRIDTDLLRAVLGGDVLRAVTKTTTSRVLRLH